MATNNTRNTQMWLSIQGQGHVFVNVYIFIYLDINRTEDIGY